MIDEKKIEEAIAKYAKETWDHEEEQFSCMDGFQAGVEWAQKEFTNSLWHDASEEPKAHTCVIVEMQDDPSHFYAIDSNHIDWKTHVKTWGYIQWCYLDDILPKIGGENG